MQLAVYLLSQHHKLQIYYINMYALILNWLLLIYQVYTSKFGLVTSMKPVILIFPPVRKRKVHAIGKLLVRSYCYHCYNIFTIFYFSVIFTHDYSVWTVGCQVRGFDLWSLKSTFLQKKYEVSSNIDWISFYNTPFYPTKSPAWMVLKSLSVGISMIFWEYNNSLRLLRCWESKYLIPD